MRTFSFSNRELRSRNHKYEGWEELIRKWNSAFLQSFLEYFESSAMLSVSLLSILGWTCSSGVVVRALASYQCGPVSISRLGVKCGFSLLVLFSTLRGFSTGTPVFPSHQKPTFDWFDLKKTIVNSDLSYVGLISSRIVNCHWKTPFGELSIRSTVLLSVSLLSILGWTCSGGVVGWVCLFSSLLWEFFSTVLRFSPLLKNLHLINFDFINLICTRPHKLWALKPIVFK